MNSGTRCTKLAVSSTVTTVPLMTSPQSKWTYVFRKMLVHKLRQLKKKKTVVSTTFYLIIGAGVQQSVQQIVYGIGGPGFDFW